MSIKTEIRFTIPLEGRTTKDHELKFWVNHNNKIGIEIKDSAGVTLVSHDGEDPDAFIRMAKTLGQLQ